VDPEAKATAAQAEPVGKGAAILKAAVAVFSMHGYHASTVADVAKEAGVATGTIYNYFERKEDLLIELFRRYLERYLVLQNTGLDSESPGEEQVRGFVHRHFEVFGEERGVARVFHVHWREVQPLIREGILPSLRTFFGVMDRVVREGIQAGEFDPELNLRLARQLISGALDEVVISWALSDGSRVLMDSAEPLSGMLCRAMRP
jgi:TetR/AcrR family fatty acid metabolism transcriptional regulator